MPKPPMKEPFKTLCHELVETMTAGLHEWRPDLFYPESYSDYQACLQAVFRSFEIKRRSVPLDRDEVWDR